MANENTQKLEKQMPPNRWKKKVDKKTTDQWIHTRSSEIFSEKERETEEKTCVGYPLCRAVGARLTGLAAGAGGVVDYYYTTGEMAAHTSTSR